MAKAIACKRCGRWFYVENIISKEPYDKELCYDCNFAIQSYRSNGDKTNITPIKTMLITPRDSTVF